MIELAWHVGLTRNTNGRVENPERLWEILNAYTAETVGPETKVTLRFSKDPSLSTQTYLASANALLMTRDVQECATEGFDGVMVAGSIDPGLDEARSITDMPVVGPIEAAVALSGFIGRRAGVVTITGAIDRYSYARIIEDNITKYGCQGRLLRNRPVRPLRQSWAEGYRAYNDAVNGDGTSFLAGFDEVASELIEDGADVIICGNQLFGPLLHHFGRRSLTPEGIPFICNAVAGLKALQTLAGLRRSMGLVKSSAGVFHQAPDTMLAAVPGWLASR